ncbi:MAG: hypothetical protein GY861_22050 [bacterium]|nr:hypothetical protein [bacterium]
MEKEIDLSKGNSSNIRVGDFVRHYSSDEVLKVVGLKDDLASIISIDFDLYENVSVSELYRFAPESIITIRMWRSTEELVYEREGLIYKAVSTS